MEFHNRRLVRSFGYALQGLYQACKYEANIRIHLAAAALALTAGVVCQISSGEWLALLLTITLVIFAELMNTAVEANVDLVTKKYKPQARIAKDVAAGAVLVTSLNAVLIGLLIFAPRLWELTRQCF